MLQSSGSRRLTSIFFQRGHSLEYVRAGSTFRKVRKDQMVETAQIKSVYSDPSGVPHVKFDIEMRKPHWPTYKEGPRILSLPVFFKNYDERVVD